MPKPKNANSTKTPPFINLRGLVIAGVALLLVGIAGLIYADYFLRETPKRSQAKYVGRQSCVKCHQQQTAEFLHSDHDRAMDLATPETVLADFNNATITQHGVESKMFRNGDKFMVHTEGPDGKMQDFQIKYVFGVNPIQQYMVEFDREPDMPANEIGRLQVLRISWDTIKNQWFYLPAPDVAEKLEPGDPLHWTGYAQCWNTMCADCHSTNLKKNYHVDTQRYHTTYSEIDVSCEACHGPGSTHVQLASRSSLFWDREQGYGLAKLKGESPKNEIATCVRCHSRRRIVHPDFSPGDDFYDFFANELLREETYHVDGQILDEVYVHGSFIQSKMYHKGIRCTDCHNPHTAKVKHQGNKLCTSCHAHAEAKYDTPAHHHHQAGSKGAQCVECHMPETTYMEIDPRRDHSLRIPRPDLSVATGAPNSCTGCHLKEDKILQKLPAASQKGLRQYNDWLRVANNEPAVKKQLSTMDQWALDNVEKWYGKHAERPVSKHFASAFNNARRPDLLQEAGEDPAAAEELMRIARNQEMPAIVRATAMFELTRFSTPDVMKRAAAGLKDADPQVRIASLMHYPPFYEQAAAQAGNLNKLQPEQLAALAGFYEPQVEPVVKLLTDRSRAVRAEAARTLSFVPRALWGKVTTSKQRSAFDAAAEEFRVGLMETNDRAAAHLTLGSFYENLGREDAAVTSYETAIKVQPTVTGPRSNLAELYDRKQRSIMQRAQQLVIQRKRPEAEKLAGEAAGYATRLAQLRAEELVLMGRDARLAPDNGVIQYRYGFAAYLNGELEEAEKALRRAVAIEPENPQFLLALTLLLEKLKRYDEALKLCQQLLEMQPSPGNQGLLRRIQAGIAGGAANVPATPAPASDGS